MSTSHCPSCPPFVRWLGTVLLRQVMDFRRIFDTFVSIEGQNVRNFPYSSRILWPNFGTFYLSNLIFGCPENNRNDGFPDISRPCGLHACIRYICNICIYMSAQNPNILLFTDHAVTGHQGYKSRESPKCRRPLHLLTTPILKSFPAGDSYLRFRRLFFQSTLSG